MKRAVNTVALAAVVCVSSCGGDGGSGDSSASGQMTSTADTAEATPADEVDGEVMTGEFLVLDSAPEGSVGVEGRAWLAQNDDGTTVTIELSGLRPDVEYVSHLHERACGEAGGGPHFRFDPDGSDVPPNEVHLGFAADADGNGGATATNEQQVGERAPAIVVHPADAMDAQLACADFL